MTERYTIHWWDGFNADHQGKDPLPPKEAEAELKFQIKRGAVRGELRTAAGTRVLAFDRGEAGQAVQSYPSRRRA